MTSSYFKLVPDIKYNKKPIEYPFSQSDFVIAKNFFKRFKINTLFDDSRYYQKYIINESYTRVEQLAEAYYGNPKYDWIIILTNRLINPQFDFPLTTPQLQAHVEKNYDDPYNTVRHYEIVSNEYQEETFGQVLFDEGTRVDKTFYETSHQYWNGTTVVAALGSNLSYPVTEYEYESLENEKRREIYLLRPLFVDDFIDDIRKQTKYKKSSSYVSAKVKEAGK